MRILISDFSNVMVSDYRLTMDAIASILPEAQVQVLPYADDDAYYAELAKADGLITAFLPLDAAFFSRAKRLRCVSINAVGYDSVDLQAAKQHGVIICHIKDYCTDEVAEHTMALLLALNRNLKYYTGQIDREFRWQYRTIPGGRPLRKQTLAVFGFGRIGRKVSAFARGFGMKVLAVSPNLTAEDAACCNVRAVTAQEAFAQADVISNHMNLTADNVHFFDSVAFAQMKRAPLFLNVGRGACVDEVALAEALDSGKIRGAGLDVLAEEEPHLAGHPLVGRNNVIITPHSAFYSQNSLDKLQTISGRNLAYCLNELPEKAQKVVAEM
ncbi:NAD(P)-dependent oxidoreductase [Sporolactobacillus nakayamae]|uniref:D-3-phosphoglycerate dehydrogenase n=1 Tax=Sporolactobacillus nakayamae TaxID=269670 RepID=A0A1I2R424_9BACL|nr:NAD(P)-dependent oxidoreductase [Sporolactobacillus nakayamae]SFG33337.1 D-3-phosphoglycerate dehydrogenase [Sporolactobacillus nakayamae]